jgi:hypothetical protein
MVKGRPAGSAGSLRPARPQASPAGPAPPSVYGPAAPPTSVERAASAAPGLQPPSCSRSAPAISSYIRTRRCHCPAMKSRIITSSTSRRPARSTSFSAHSPGAPLKNGLPATARPPPPSGSASPSATAAAPPRGGVSWPPPSAASRSSAAWWACGRPAAALWAAASRLSSRAVRAAPSCPCRPCPPLPGDVPPASGPPWRASCRPCRP